MAGVTLQTYNSNDDALRVARTPLFTSVVHVGYRLTRAVTAEVQVEVLLPENIRERTFDEAGVATDIRAPGSGLGLFMGGLIRVDDLLAPRF
jgi:hypothetical protein